MLFRITHGLHNTTVTVHKILSSCSKMFSYYVWDDHKCASSLVQHRAVRVMHTWQICFIMKIIRWKDQIESIWATWTYIVLKTT